MIKEKVKVAILGGSGYTAIELIKILLRHPHAEIVAITSRQDEQVADLHPSLLGRFKLRCEPFDADAIKGKCVQVAFGCLPHGTSMEAVPPLLEREIRVIDLSADYRLRDAKVYEEWYKEPHHDTANLKQAIYGLPELFGDKVEGAKLIANPGCYPQTGILGLAPLVARGLIELSGIVIDSKSGVSGGGRTPKLSFHFPECNESVSAYSVGTHRHTPEIEQALSVVAGKPVSVIFTPHLIPMDRGILSTIYATPTRTVSENELVEIYRAYYSEKPFVRLRSSPPATKDTVGTNFLDICVKLVRGKVLVIAAEDNLIRGASGVAVQNFNLMFGFDERMGLM
ncbi:MAG TPA: N-acetyl-gamma-glutamyl-phosphate reductase [Gemmata sp.]|nr:N-acetyl-gamma-glutamyl-phosphate reductase [Gemmata sp.]